MGQKQTKQKAGGHSPICFLFVRIFAGNILFINLSYAVLFQNQRGGEPAPYGIFRWCAQGAGNTKSYESKPWARTKKGLVIIWVSLYNDISGKGDFMPVPKISHF